MDPSADINLVTGSNALQTVLSGEPQLGSSTEQEASRALGINRDKLILEQKTDGEEVQSKDEAGHEVTFECPICFGPYTHPNAHPTAIKKCGHVFCGACLAETIKKHKKCPTCQVKATKRHMLRIYL